MIVVSDTSPLTVLLTVGEDALLLRLFSEVIIPTAVRDELLRNHAQLPEWLRVASVHNTAQAAKYSQLVDVVKPRRSSWPANSTLTGCLSMKARAANSPSRKDWR
jgi:hypothetical protein